MQHHGVAPFPLLVFLFYESVHYSYHTNESLFLSFPPCVSRVSHVYASIELGLAPSGLSLCESFNVVQRGAGFTLTGQSGLIVLVRKTFSGGSRTTSGFLPQTIMDDENIQQVEWRFYGILFGEISIPTHQVIGRAMLNDMLDDSVNVIFTAARL